MPLNRSKNRKAHARRFGGYKKPNRLMKLRTERKVQGELNRRHIQETVAEVEHLLRNVRLGDD